MLCRLIAWIFALITLGLAGWEAWIYSKAGAFALTPLGKIWFDLHSSSLNTLQAGIERHVWPPLWQNVLFPVIQQPAILVAAVTTVVLFLLCYLRIRRRDRRPTFKS